MEDTSGPTPAPEGLDAYLKQTVTPGTESANAPARADNEEPEGLNEYLGLTPSSPKLSVDANSAMPGTGSPTEQAFNPGAEQNNEKLNPLTDVEGFARGMSGGLSDVAMKGARTLAEKYSDNPDMWAPKPEDVEARANTTEGKLLTAGGLGAGILTGAGVPGLIMGGTKALMGATGIKALAAAEGAGVFSKLGAAALTGAIETGAITGTDKISKALLGQKDGDPEAAASSALTDVGISGLIGGAFGATGEATGLGLKALADTKVGNAISKNMADFGSRWNQLKQFGEDRVAALHDELTNYFNATNHATDEVYGMNGLKDSAIKTLVPKEITPALVSQTQSLDEAVASKLQDMASSPESYPKYLMNGFAKQVGDWQSVINNPQTSPYEVFNATQKLKQYTQEMAKYDMNVSQFHPGFKFKSDMGDLATKLKSSLEDSEVWGKAGDLQAGVNKSFSEFLPNLKEFQKKFTSDIQGERVVDPNKINTYLNQLGKPSAEIKQDIMSDFLDASDKFHQQVGKLHDTLGVQNSIVPPPTTLAKLTVNKDLGPGAKLADYMYNHGLDNLGKKAVETVGSGIGAVAGQAVAGPFGIAPGLMIGNMTTKAITPLLAKTLGPSTKELGEYGTSAALRVLGSQDPAGMTDALNYARSVQKGQSTLNKAAKSLFTTGAVGISDEISDRDKKKLIDYINNGGVTQEMQPTQPSTDSEAPPAFAEGGQVKASIKKPLAPSQNQTALEQHFPEQNMMLSAAKGRISNYLSTLKPQENNPKLPFDQKLPQVQQERTYNNALKIALNPVSVVNRIKNGDLTIEHMKHLTQMYPEIHNQLSQKITEGIMKSQLEGERPSYKTRQMMSLFLGSALDSTMTPQGIMAAQATFKPSAPQPPPQSPDKPMKGRKGKTAIDKLGAEYTTPSQAGDQRASGAKD